MKLLIARPDHMLAIDNANAADLVWFQMYRRQLNDAVIMEKYPDARQISYDVTGLKCIAMLVDDQ